jgi:hypothetical protein
MAGPEIRIIAVEELLLQFMADPIDAARPNADSRQPRGDGLKKRIAIANG